MATIYYLIGDSKLHTTSKRAALRAAKDDAAAGIETEVWACDIGRPSLDLILTILNNDGGGWAVNPQKIFTAKPKAVR